MITRVAAIVCVIVFTIGLASAQQPTTPPSTRRTTKSRAKASTTGVSAEIQQLRGMVEQQQRQIDDLRQQLATRDQAVQSAQQQAVAAQSAATQAATQAAAAAADASTAQQAAASLKTDVGDLKGNATTTALALQEEQKRVTELTESPLALHYKGITITPGGFLAAETVYRQRGTASDVNTPFTSIPFPGSGAQHLSEFFGSGRQSRLTFLMEGKVKTAKLSGYYEMDWLSAGVTSNNNQSNSYTNRQRQLWGQVAFTNGFTITGGQMWSLVAETKKGLDNRTEALPMTIDAQYTAGFSWARQYGFRLTKNFNNKVWFGMSVENPQTTVTVHGNVNNFLVGAPGTSGGLYNAFNGTYSFNYVPDFIVKAAFEPGFGHYEVFGILSNFRSRVYPLVTSTVTNAGGAYNDIRTAGGGGANARWSVFNKHIDIGVHGLAGDGVGRYGTSTLADATARTDGTLAPLHAYQALGTLEYHSKKWDIYGYGGGEYVERAFYKTGTRVAGYGAPAELSPGSAFSNAGCFTEVAPGGAFVPGGPGSCVADVRNVMEGTIGFWHKPYNGPKGRVQWGLQYSY
ncbi:MAG: hypothetical protein JO187_08910, partial [Acidobacteria bacterium]|nr:hypothetical protein [Acidobacteriota bacterium]